MCMWWRTGVGGERGQDKKVPTGQSPQTVRSDHPAARTVSDLELIITPSQCHSTIDGNPHDSLLRPLPHDLAHPIWRCLWSTGT